MWSCVYDLRHSIIESSARDRVGDAGERGLLAMKPHNCAYEPSYGRRSPNRNAEQQ